MSNLLDKASIILTPTAYNNGEALCVKPSDGSGDFDFSRNSAATRVNAQGLVENVQILSSNLVQNGDFSEEGVQEVSNGSFSQEGVELVTNGNFDTDSDWIKVNATIGGGTGNLDSTSSSSILFQQSVLVVGKTYKAILDVTNYNGLGTCALINSNGETQFEITSNGNKEFYFTQGGSSTNLSFRAVSGGIFSIDNVSVREVGQDWTLGTGWSIGEDKAVANTTGSTNGLLQTSTITSGKIYKATFEVLDYQSGSVRINLGGAGLTGVGNLVSANGVYTQYITSDGVDVYMQGRVGFNGSITNISVKEVGQNWLLDSANIEVGKLTLNSVGGAMTYASQIGLTLVANTSYLISLNATRISGDTNLAFGSSGVNNVVDSPIISTSGIQSYNFTPTTNVSNFGLKRNAGGSGAVWEVTNISVIEITDDTNLPRINYEGFSYQDALGSELVVNGDFEDGSANWTLGVGHTVSGSKLNINGASFTYQPVQQTVSSRYRLSFSVSNYVSGTIRVYTGSGTSSVRIDASSDGNFELDYIANGNTVYVQPTGGIFIGSIDNVSIKEVITATNTPRLDYSTGAEAFLLEPQSTNLVPYSEDFTQWNGNSIVLTSGFTSPDGTSGATLLSGNGVSSFANINQSLSASGDVSYSLFVKKELSDTISLRVQGTDIGGAGFVNAVYTYTFSTNSFVSASSGVAESFSAQPLVDGWVRLELNFTSTTITACRIYSAYNSTSAQGVYIWGAQLEQQSYATSYIPTSGTTVTRNQETCINATPEINSEEGVLYVEINAENVYSNSRYIALSNGTTSNRVIIGISSNSTGTITCFVSSGGSTVAILSSTADITDFNKVALRYRKNNFSLFLNGVKASTDTSGLPPVELNRLAYGNGVPNATPFYGSTKDIQVYTKALSDAELIKLTT